MSIVKLLPKPLDITAQIPDLVGLFDGTVVVALANDEQTFSRMTPSAAGGAGRCSITLDKVSNDLQ